MISQKRILNKIEAENAQNVIEGTTGGFKKGKIQRTKTIAESTKEEIKANVELMNDLNYIKTDNRNSKPKDLSSDFYSIQLYLLRPPQMQFIPSEEELTTLIKKAMSVKSETDIPQIFGY